MAAVPAMFATLARTPAMERAGFRFGARGTHSSRILYGEPPCDIFVRWRPLPAQAIG